MASLITYKFYVGAKNSSPKKYILVFTMFNVCYLAALGITPLLSVVTNDIPAAQQYSMFG